MTAGWNRGPLTTLFNRVNSSKSSLYPLVKGSMVKTWWWETGFLNNDYVDKSYYNNTILHFQGACFWAAFVLFLSPTPFNDTNVYNPNSPVFRNIRFIMRTEHWSPPDRSSIMNNGHIHRCKSSSPRIKHFDGRCILGLQNPIPVGANYRLKGFISYYMRNACTLFLFY